jgi:hypothetical protein
MGQSPRHWVPALGPYCDLAALTVRMGAEAQPSFGASSPALDLKMPEHREPLYLPPTFEPAHARRLDGFVAAAMELGIPVVRQIVVSPADAAAEAGGWPRLPISTELYLEVVDPLWLRLEDRLDRLWGRLAERCREVAQVALIWPLLPGFANEPEAMQETALRVRTAGCTVLQPCWLGIEPSEKRILFERWPDAFDYQRLFQVLSGEERLALEASCHEMAARAGLATTAPRLYPATLSPRQLRCRQIAVRLALRADELARSGASPARVQSFYTACNELEQTRLNLDALWREGNLAFLGIDDEPLSFLKKHLDSESA